MSGIAPVLTTGALVIALIAIAIALSVRDGRRQISAMVAAVVVSVLGLSVAVAYFIGGGAS